MNKKIVKFINIFCVCVVCFIIGSIKCTMAFASNNTEVQSVVDTVEPPTGDVNFDGKVDLRDAKLALNVALGTVEVSDAAVRAGDMNKNGTIDISDAKVILNRALGNE